jgi:ABC-type uncharacterized transport system involved in gliding motility auxiliary subunit
MNKQKPYLTLALIAVGFFAINLLAGVGLKSARIDLTQDSLFTLSQGARNTLGGLTKDIKLEFYFSEDVAAEMPQIRTYGKRVREMLISFSDNANGKVTVVNLNPKAFSKAEDNAIAAEIEGVPTNKGDLLYFGLIASSSDGRREVISFFGQERDRFLEYDLARLIHILNQEKRPVVGMITNLPLDTGPGGLLLAMRGLSQPFVAYQELVDTFELLPLERDFLTVPENVDVLIIAHPAKLTDASLYAIDQFILSGGRAAIFVDPFSEMSQIPGPDGTPLKGATDSSNLDPLFATWGIELAKDADGDPLVIGDKDAALPVTTQNLGRRVLTDFILWLGLDNDNINKDDPVSANLARVNMASVGHLKVIATDTGLTLTPLIKTTGNGQFLAKKLVKTRPHPADLLKDFVPSGDEYIIAARLNGSVATAFPDGPPREIKKVDLTGADDNPLSKDLAQLAKQQGANNDVPADHLAKSTEPINLIVVTDTDIFDDRFWVRITTQDGQKVVVPTADNVNFMVNAIENLTGSNDLISLRSRSMGVRPFTRIVALRDVAEDKFQAQERQLEEKLSATENELLTLRKASEKKSDAETAAIEKFKVEIASTKEALRIVQRNLRQDIEVLENRLRGLNILAMPLVVVFCALLVGFLRLRRRAQVAP